MNPSQSWMTVFVALLVFSLIPILSLDNIENLPEYSYGLTADDIVVFVIFDGREKVHPSIFHVSFYSLSYSSRDERMTSII